MQFGYTYIKVTEREYNGCADSTFCHAVNRGQHQDVAGMTLACEVSVPQLVHAL